MQNSSEEITRKHAGVPTQREHSPTPQAILTHPRISQAGSRENSSFHQDYHARGIAVALGRCLGARALEKMPKGKSVGWSPPGGREKGQGCQQNFGGGAPIHRQPWLQPCPHCSQLHPQPRKLSSFSANPFYIVH